MTTDPFEKTFELPVSWNRAAADYVRDTAEWVARCLARVTQLDPILKVEEAEAAVHDMSRLERWRVLSPEGAAEQLYAPIRRPA